MKELAIEKLMSVGLKKTEIRIQILNYLLQKRNAISQPDLEKEFKTISDRVTLYRALSSFEEKGLIHKIIDKNGTARFALCDTEKCLGHIHHDEHIHFHCDNCGEIICLNEKTIPEITLPEKFTVQKININIEGVCEICNLKNSITE